MASQTSHCFPPLMTPAGDTIPAGWTLAFDFSQSSPAEPTQDLKSLSPLRRDGGVSTASAAWRQSQEGTRPSRGTPVPDWGCWLLLTCDVAQRPHGLLADVHVWGGEEGDEGWDGTPIHHRLGVLRGARCNVGQRPGGLKLQLSAVSTGEELHQPGDDAQLDDLVERRVLLPGQHSPARKGTAQPTLSRPSLTWL